MMCDASIIGGIVWFVVVAAVLLYAILGEN